MGNQLTTDTLCSRDSSGHSYWVGVDWKSFSKGERKKCYLGCLNGKGPRLGEKVVVRAFRNRSGSREVWNEEITKSEAANLLLKMFKSQVAMDENIRINTPFPALMDSVSKMNEIFGYRSRSRSLNSNEWVGIEPFIPGKFGRFCVTENVENLERSPLLEAFSHFTYHQSRGAFVVCDFEGSFQDSCYHVTNPTIHSQTNQFGAADDGIHGINEFFRIHRCNDICRHWARMTPLSPPPSFDDIYAELSSTFRVTPTAPHPDWLD